MAEKLAFTTEFNLFSRPNTTRMQIFPSRKKKLSTIELNLDCEILNSHVHFLVARLPFFFLSERF